MPSFATSIAAIALTTTLAAAAAPPPPLAAQPVAPRSTLPPHPAGDFGTTLPAAAPATAPGATVTADAQNLRLRLQAMRVAADEMPLPPDVKTKLVARISQAERQQATAAAVSAQADPSAAAAAGVVARLTADTNALLKDQARPFNVKAAAVADEAQGWMQPSTGGLRRMMDLVLTLKPDQAAALDRVMNDASARRMDAAAAPEPVRSDRLLATGFASRAASRAVLTPQQLKQWDDLLQRTASRNVPQAAAQATTRTAASTQPTSRPALALPPEAWMRFEVMLLAAQEGPYTPEQRQKLTARIQQARDEFAAVANQPVSLGQESPLKQFDAMHKRLSLDIVDILSGKADDFDRRRDHINGELIALRSASLPLDHTWISDFTNDLMLTDAQQAKIDKLLADRIETLKQIDQQAAADNDAAVTKLRKEQAAMEVRAAMRAVLTADQRKKLDRYAVP